MRIILAMLTALCLGSAAQAQVQLPKDLFSAGGALMSSGIIQLNANLGDIISGASATGTTEVQHGFWTTPLGQIVGVDGPLVTSMYFLRTPQPNPARASTLIEFGLPIDEHVSLRVYDVSGRMVQEIVNATLPTGVYRKMWNLHANAHTGVTAGMYLARLSTRTFTAVRKLVVLE